MKDIYDASRGNLVAVTGRRRIGKTYLVRSYFHGRLDFELSGTVNAGLHEQLQNFDFALRGREKRKGKRNIPGTWTEAFQQLARHLERTGKKNKKQFANVKQEHEKHFSRP